MCVCVQIFVNQIKILFNGEVPYCIYKSRVLIHIRTNCMDVCVCDKYVNQIKNTV